MKRMFGIVLLAAICLSVLTGCGTSAPTAPAATEAPAPAPTEEPEMGQAPVLGGWRAAESNEISEQLRTLFDKAMEGLVGVSYEPLAYLGSQTVAGTNHSLLCGAQVVAPGAQPYYAIVTLYEKPDGSVEIADIAGLTPAGDFDENAGSAEQIPGSWTVCSNSEAGFAAFEKAKNALLGVDYTPVWVLGSQVVAGTNYSLLCRAQTVTPGAEAGYVLARVYEKLDGSAEITEIWELSPAGLPLD